jgi:two-component system phosphate regulon response regulator PhoB
VNENVLVVEDDASIREMIRFTLESDGYHCYEAEELTEAEAILSRENIQMVLIDWMLPGLSGIELAKRLRRDKKRFAIPIILVTAKAEETDKLKGFSVGIDDYVTKPFSTNELLARIRAVLRRTTISKDPCGESPLVIDQEKKLALHKGNKIRLTSTEFRLLSFLLSRDGKVYSRGELITKVWQDNEEVDERTVDVHIRRLRKALEPFGCHSYIQTARGFGYCFSTNIS